MQAAGWQTISGLSSRYKEVFGGKLGVWKKGALTRVSWLAEEEEACDGTGRRHSYVLLNIRRMRIVYAYVCATGCFSLASLTVSIRQHSRTCVRRGLFFER